MKALRRSLLLLSLVSSLAFASTPPDPPNLVVMISLDQYPCEYLTRFRPYLHGGLARLLEEGAFYANATYKHAECITGPGHAVLLTGTYGNVNGIVMNSWLDAETGDTVYCAEDTAAHLVGAQGEGRSPRRLLSSTFGDMLRLHTGFQSRVLSLSNKDRAAIMLGGRMPNGVYWLVDSQFVTSTYYRNDLPAWVSSFNASGVINAYFGRTWERTAPAEADGALDAPGRTYFDGHDSLGRQFPHLITGKNRRHITRSFYSALGSSPFGAEILEAFAEKGLDAERLGARGVTDLLCLSFSSTDLVGHAFGPQSQEALEMTLAIDRILGRLFAVLDSSIGLSHCVVVLSSDHGVAPIPEYVQGQSPNAGARRVSTRRLVAACDSALHAAFGPGAPGIRAAMDHNLYLDRAALRRLNIDRGRAAEVVADAARHFPGVATAVNLDAPASGCPSDQEAAVWKSYHPARSGDVFYILQPFCLEGGDQGTGHGDPWSYNAHVPVIFWGAPIVPGWYGEEASPADIAPTLSTLLGVELPTGRQGRVLQSCLRK